MLRRFLAGLSVGSCAFGVTTAFCSMSSTPTTYRSVEPFYNFPQDYEDRGQLALGEEPLILHMDVFAQMGVVLEESIAHMLAQWPLASSDVFCDLGSGVGNVCLAVFANSHVRKTIGIEFIPSRHQYAVAALQTAAAADPTVFANAARRVEYHNQNFTECADICREVTVFFTHSWTFDPPLLDKTARVIAAAPKVRLVLTSREMPQLLTSTKLQYRGVMTLGADWNEKAPFHVYSL